MANNSLLAPNDDDTKTSETSEVLEPVETSEEETKPSRFAEVAEVMARGGSTGSLLSTAFLGKDVTQDLLRVAGDTASSVGQAAKDVVNIAASPFTDEDVISQETADKVEGKVAKQIEEASGYTEIYDEENKDYVETETMTGAAAEIASFIYVGSKVSKISPVNKLPSFKKEAVATFITDQLLGDPDNNLGNVVSEMTESDILDFLAAKETDSDVVKRLKLAGEGLGLGTLVALIGKTIGSGKKIYDKYKKPIDELTPEEQGEVFVDALTEVRDETQAQVNRWTEDDVDPEEIADQYLNRSRNVKGLQDPEYKIEYNETPEGVAQVEMQASGPIRRFVNQVFSSRGYWTPKAYDAFEDAQYAQRQAVAQAEHVANRLQKSLRALGSELETKEVTELAQEALKADLGFVAGATREEKVLDLVDKFSLPSEVAENVLDARELIDGFSKSLVGSSGVPDAIKETIVENSGMYLRRSYRLYEDSGYKPSLDVVEDAQEYLVRQNMDINPSLSYEEALAKADADIQDILGETDQTNVFEYFSSVRKVNKEIMQGRKDIPEPIRALIGEVKEPAENIILTVSKMSRFYETNKFFTVLENMGSGKYIFDAGDTARDPSMFNVKISGTNSKLDGKYTTPEMLSAIKEQQSNLGVASSDNFVGAAYRNFLTLKGVSQKAKTVYSHVTHLRNFMGGMQFSLANGSMPFGESTVQTFKTLKNQISQGGEEALDDLYEEYLRLGIINTNVRANEFRDLLETGYNSTADNLADAVSEKLSKYGLPKGVQDAPGNVYVATDDFFKITQYNKELDTLKEAFPNEDIKVLQEEAANVVRNTIPNYDRVPNGIKTLRGLPFGSFVSFPAEIYRTSMNIVRQSSKEISSGNPKLAARGARRLAGFSTSVVGWGGMATLSANMVGFDEDQQKSAHVLTETPWSKDAPRVWMNMDDKLFYMDTQFIDSYSAIKEPVLAVMHQIQNGQLKGKELDNYLLDASVAGLTAVVKPYVSEAILTKTISDLVFAYKDDAGRTPEGKEIFTPGLPTSEKLGNFMYHGLQAFLPGSVTSVQGLVDAAMEKPQRTTGATKDLSAELIANMSGVRFKELNISDSLTFAVKDYRSKRSAVISSSPNFERTSENLVERYRLEQKENFKLQQELYRKVSAAIDLVDLEGVLPVLIESGLSQKEAAQIVQGLFMPNVKDKNFYINVYKKTPDGEKVVSGTADEIQKLYADMMFQPLVSPEEVTRLEKKRGFAKGGEVFVPNAPPEPDERIDKMTGLPYNYQAGKAFVDEEEVDARAMLAGGGAVKAGAKILDKASEHVSAIKKGFHDLTDGLFSDETADIAENKIKDRVNDTLLSTGRDDLIDSPELEMYLETTTQDILSGGRDLDLVDGQKIAELKDPTPSFKSYIARGTGAETPEDMSSEVFEDYQSLKSSIDPGGQIFDAIFDGLYKPRAEYRKLTANLDAPVSMPRNTQTLEEILSGNINADPELTTTLSDAGQKRLVKAQVNALATDPDTAEAVQRIAKESPVEADIPEVVNVNSADRERMSQAFVAESQETVPFYRAVSDYGNKEWDVAFAAPREIGVHVGNEGQANHIALKAANPLATVDNFEYVKGPTREMFDEDFAKVGRAAADESEAFRMAREQDPTITQAEFDMDSEVSYPQIVMTRGYINVRNPLKIESDLGSWKAQDIVLYDDRLEIIIDAVEDQAGPDVLFYLEEMVEPIVAKANIMEDLAKDATSTYDKEKVKILGTEINLMFRDMLEELGFDSIKYKNTFEGSLPNEEDTSYILFKPEQYKSVNAERFDPNDRRFGKFEGGKILDAINNKIQKAQRSVALSAAEKVGLPRKDIEWAENLGKQYGEKEISNGRGDAARHLALGWLAQRSSTPKAAKFGIDLRETFTQKPMVKQMDLKNNQMGYEMQAADKAEAERKIRQMVESQKAMTLTPDQAASYK